MNMLLESERDVRRAIAELREGRRCETPRLDAIHAAVRGEVGGLYVPKKATAEYLELLRMSRFNVMGMVVRTVAQGLYVEGYRDADGEKSPLWDTVWQANRMDARQRGLWRSAIEYGLAYTRVLPGQGGAVVTPLSPRRCTALYEDPINDEWPQLAMVWGKRHKAGAPVPGIMYDDQFAYYVTVSEGNGSVRFTAEPQRHGLGVVPFVRFSDADEDLDDGPQGKVEPLIASQRQLNQTTYSLLVTQNFGAFRQRYVTGMTIEEDENGTPREPFNVRVDGILQAESPDARFGEFSANDLTSYLSSRESVLQYVASVANVPPHTMVLGTSISNISAEALAALEAGHRQDIAEYQSTFGESVEQMMRLGARCLGDTEGWSDTSSQVVWRDTTPRSLAQVADALGKLATQLGIPPRALWERIPGVTQQDIALWESMADESDAMGNLGQLLGALPGGEPEPEAPPVQAVPAAAA